MDMYHTIYECPICGGLHDHQGNIDCRDDDHRFSSVADYAKREGVDESKVIVSWTEAK